MVLFDNFFVLCGQVSVPSFMYLGMYIGKYVCKYYIKVSASLVPEKQLLPQAAYLGTLPHASDISGTPGNKQGEETFGFQIGLYSKSRNSGLVTKLLEALV